MPDLNPAENVTEGRIITSRRTHREKSEAKSAVAEDTRVTDDRLVELFEDKMKQRIELYSSKESDDTKSTIAKICDHEEEIEMKMISDELKNIKDRMANAVECYEDLARLSPPPIAVIEGASHEIEETEESFHISSADATQIRQDVDNLLFSYSRACREREQVLGSLAERARKFTKDEKEGKMRSPCAQAIKEAVKAGSEISKNLENQQVLIQKLHFLQGAILNLHRKALGKPRKNVCSSTQSTGTGTHNNTLFEEWKSEHEAWKYAAEEIVDLLHVARKEGSDKVDEAAANFQALMNSFRFQTQHMDQLQGLLKDLENKVATLETERNRLENDNILLQDQVANVNKGKMVVREKMKILEKEKKGHEQEKQMLQDKLATASTEIKRIQEVSGSLESRLHMHFDESGRQQLNKPISMEVQTDVVVMKDNDCPKCAVLSENIDLTLQRAEEDRKNIELLEKELATLQSQTGNTNQETVKSGVEDDKKTEKSQKVGTAEPSINSQTPSKSKLLVSRQTSYTFPENLADQSYSGNESGYTSQEMSNEESIKEKIRGKKATNNRLTQTDEQDFTGTKVLIKISNREAANDKSLSALAGLSSSGDRPVMLANIADTLARVANFAEKMRESTESHANSPTADHDVMDAIQNQFSALQNEFSSVGCQMNQIWSLPKKSDTSHSKQDARNAKLDGNSSKLAKSSMKLDPSSLKVDSRNLKLDSNHAKHDKGNLKQYVSSTKLQSSNVKLDSSNAKLQRSDVNFDLGNAKLDKSNAELNQNDTQFEGNNVNTDSSYRQLGKSNGTFDRYNTEFEGNNVNTDSSYGQLGKSNGTFDRYNTEFEGNNVNTDSSYGQLGKSNGTFDRYNTALEGSNLNFDSSYAKHGKSNGTFDRYSTALEGSNLNFDSSYAKHGKSNGTFDRYSTALEGSNLNFDSSNAKHGKSNGTFDRYSTALEGSNLNFDSSYVKHGKSNGMFDSHNAEVEGNNINFDSGYSKHWKSNGQFGPCNTGFQGNNLNFDSSYAKHGMINGKQDPCSTEFDGSNVNSNSSYAKHGKGNKEFNPNNTGFQGNKVNFDSRYSKHGKSNGIFDPYSTDFQGNNANFNSSHAKHGLINGKLDPRSTEFEGNNVSFNSSNAKHEKNNGKFDPYNSEFRGSNANFDSRKVKLDYSSATHDSEYYQTIPTSETQNLLQRTWSTEGLVPGRLSDKQRGMKVDRNSEMQQASGKKTGRSVLATKEGRSANHGAFDGTNQLAPFKLNASLGRSSDSKRNQLKEGLSQLKPTIARLGSYGEGSNRSNVTEGKLDRQVDWDTALDEISDPAEYVNMVAAELQAYAARKINNPNSRDRDADDARMVSFMEKAERMLQILGYTIYDIPWAKVPRGNRFHATSAKKSRVLHNMSTITNPQMTPEMYKKLDKLIAMSLAHGQGSAYSMGSTRTEGLSNAEQRHPSASRSMAKDGISMQQRGRDQNHEDDPFKRKYVAKSSKLFSEGSSFPQFNTGYPWVANARDARLLKGKLSSGPEFMRCESSQTFFDVIGRLASRKSYGSVKSQKHILPPIDVEETNPQELVISRLSCYGEQNEDGQKPKIIIADENGMSIKAKDPPKRLLTEGKAHISLSLFSCIANREKRPEHAPFGTKRKLGHPEKKAMRQKKRSNSRGGEMDLEMLGLPCRRTTPKPLKTKKKF